MYATPTHSPAHIQRDFKVKLWTGIAQLGERTRDAFLQAPLLHFLSLLLAIDLAVVSTYSLHALAYEHFQFALVFALVIAPLWGFAMLQAHGKLSPAQRWCGSLTALGLAVVYAYVLFEPRHLTNHWHATLSVAASWLSIPLTALALRPPGEQPSSWLVLFHVRLVIRILRLIALQLLFTVSVLFSAYSTTTLFDMPTTKLVLLAPLCCALLLFCLLWQQSLALALPRRPEEQSRIHRAQTLALSLLTPWFLGMTLILGGYQVYVLLTKQLPQNLMSPLVIGIGIGLIILQSLASSQRRVAPHSRLLRTLSHISLACLPLLPTALWAMWVRIGQYGWTEFRYLRMVALLCLLCYGIRQILALCCEFSTSTTEGLVTTGTLVFLCLCGPWSISNYPKVAQQQRLQRQLQAVGLNPRALPHRPRKISHQDYAVLYSTYRYLRTHFGAAALYAPLHTPAHHKPDPWAPIVKALRLKSPNTRGGMVMSQPHTPIQVFDITLRLDPQQALPALAYDATHFLRKHWSLTPNAISKPHTRKTQQDSIWTMRYHNQTLHLSYHDLDADRPLQFEIDMRGYLCRRLRRDHKGRYAREQVLSPAHTRLPLKKQGRLYGHLQLLRLELRATHAAHIPARLPRGGETKTCVFKDISLKTLQGLLQWKPHPSSEHREDDHHRHRYD